MNTARHSWVILGCGYTGLRLGRRLLDHGAHVLGTRRTTEGVSELARAGIRGYRFDTDSIGAAPRTGKDASILERVPRDAIVVHCAPPGQNTPEAERALVRLIVARRVRRTVYISSTGVYPAAPGGEWIDETTPPAPVGKWGRRRWAAESTLASAAAAANVSLVALRAAGIYGPGRGVHARLREGTYRIVGNGSSWVNRVHVDDLVTAIVTAALHENPPHAVYNLADDCPLSAAEHGDAVAAMLDLPPPPRVSAESVPAQVRAMLLANRRISNRRIKEELGVRLAFPTWREGTRACLKEESGT